MATEACSRCGRQRQSERLTELFVHDNEIDLGFDALHENDPYNSVFPPSAETLPSASVRRFPSLSNSAKGSDESSSTVAGKVGHAESTNDVEETPNQRPTTLDFFDPLMAKVRRVVMKKYLWTRKSYFGLDFMYCA